MTIDGVIIPGKRGRILGTYFRTDCEQKERKPVVIICHGFPGNDQLHDFAYFLQENGYHVFCFHYSGSWGSDGSYSLSNILEDTETVVDWLLHTPDDNVDKNRIYLLCHSLGGFAGVHTFVKKKEIAAAIFISPANIVDLFEEAEKKQAMLQAFLEELREFCLPLQDVTPEKLMAEAEENQEVFRFENVAKEFGTRPVLLVRGKQDTITPASLCTDVLKKIVDTIPGNKCELVTYDAPHDYLNVRQALRERVLEFLNKTT